MRADLALVEQGLCPSRAQAQTLIDQGKVLLRTGLNREPVVVKKASQPVEPFMTLELTDCDAPSFVSRGGLKLHHALEHCELDVKNRKCLDLGQSTGGFTDCLLQRGAASVVGIDVGQGQLHPTLSKHAAVLPIEGVNLYKACVDELTSEIESLKPDFLPFELVVADLSFISLRKVLPNIARLMPPNCEGLFLVKPQFELGPEHIGKKGLVKNQADLMQQLEADIKTNCASMNLQVNSFFACDLKGGDGNQEYFVHTVKQQAASADPFKCDVTTP